MEGLIDFRRRLLAAPAIWIETTKAEHKHGGDGWSFGECLWSPSRNRSGVDIYSLMRRVSPSDAVIHFLKNSWEDGTKEIRVAAISEIASKFELREDEPPEPGSWAGMSPYYRVTLHRYMPFSHPLPLRILRETYAEEIRAELIEDRPRFFPFMAYRNEIRMVQGWYLTKATPRFVALLFDALGLEASIASNASTSPDDQHTDYAEGQRRRREAFFFARNRHLAADAKAYYGCRCRVCGFDFEIAYGDLGRGYIECHHLNPLSERSEQEWDESLKSSIADVAVLCANCHRMVHRRRPALSLDELKTAITERSIDEMISPLRED
jgi:5-methylcytosine-specific restriction endonuclease McrA